MSGQAHTKVSSDFFFLNQSAEMLRPLSLQVTHSVFHNLFQNRGLENVPQAMHTAPAVHAHNAYMPFFFAASAHVADTHAHINTPGQLFYSLPMVSNEKMCT